MNIVNNIITNPSFIELDCLLNKFNIFKATDMGRREIKHTKFLSYLLDPNESHGLGDSFLSIFLGKLPQDSLKEICITQLHTELAKITPEWNNIDILIKIPLYYEKGKYFVIAIENKIDAKQGKDQLLKYSKSINDNIIIKDCLVKKYFLTERDEEANTDEWEDITYSETVIPTFEEMLKSRVNKTSDYIRYVLNDYLSLMKANENQDSIADSLAEKFKYEEIQYIKKALTTEDEEFVNQQNLLLRHPKVCQYLKQYDQDPISKIVKRWSKLPETKVDEKLTFNIELSNRSCLRFNILSNENRFRMMSISKSEGKPWLPTQQSIAFEIGIKRSNDSMENSPKEKGKIRATLVLGPVNLDLEKRKELVNAIRTSLGYEEITSISPSFTFITQPKTLNTPYLSEIRVNEIEGWINERLIERDSNDKLILNKNLHKIAYFINEGLNNFFATNPLSNPLELNNLD